MRPYSQAALTLTVGQNAEINVDFEIQGTAERVDVEGTATLLQTQDASTGQLVNQKFIVRGSPSKSEFPYELSGGHFFTCRDEKAFSARFEGTLIYRSRSSRAHDDILFDLGDGTQR